MVNYASSSTQVTNARPGGVMLKSGHWTHMRLAVDVGGLFSVLQILVTES
jgi:hypothetical protein